MFDNFKKITINENDLVDFKLSYEPTYLTILIESVKYEFLIHLKKGSKKALVLGSGAYDPKKGHTPPIFHRHSWMDDIKDNVIYYNDPTLYLGDMNLGWGYGTHNKHYIEVIASIIKVLLEKQEIVNDDVCIYGSSAGGFMSIMLSTLFKDSIALVNNPQTDVSRYFKGFVKKLYISIYKEESENFNNFITERINLVEYFKSKNYMPNIIYHQNLASKHDLDNHLIPFIKELSTLDESISKDIEMHYYLNEKQGHNPIDKDDTLEIIKKVME